MFLRQASFDKLRTNGMELNKRWCAPVRAEREERTVEVQAQDKRNGTE